MENKDWNNVSIDNLNLSVRASNYLKNQNIRTIGELISRKNLENSNIRSEAGTPIQEISEGLDSLGLSLYLSDKDD